MAPPFCSGKSDRAMQQLSFPAERHARTGGVDVLIIAPGAFVDGTPFPS
jgi:hypothetical protein